MSLLTREDVCRLTERGTRGPLKLEPHQVLTPGARDFLQEHRIETSCPQRQRPAPGMEKPEHMTHLDGSRLVDKGHPRIAFRGMIDRLEAEVLLAQQASAEEGYRELTDQLEEVLGFVRRQIRCDVLDEPEGELRLCGYTADQLREYSHHPERCFGQSHFMPRYTDGPAMLAVNKVRTAARETELAAVRAFRAPDGRPDREDLVQALNRLSSLLWIMMIRLKAGSYERKKCC